MSNLELEEKGTRLKYPPTYSKVGGWGAGGGGINCPKVPHRCTCKAPLGILRIPGNMVRTQKGQLKDNCFSLRGLALAVMLGGAGPLLAQQ